MVLGGRSVHWKGRSCKGRLHNGICASTEVEETQRPLLAIETFINPSKRVAIHKKEHSPPQVNASVLILNFPASRTYYKQQVSCSSHRECGMCYSSQSKLIQQTSLRLAWKLNYTQSQHINPHCHPIKHKLSAFYRQWNWKKSVSPSLIAKQSDCCLCVCLVLGQELDTLSAPRYTHSCFQPASPEATNMNGKLPLPLLKEDTDLSLHSFWQQRLSHRSKLLVNSVLYALGSFHFCNSFHEIQSTCYLQYTLLKGEISGFQCLQFPQQPLLSNSTTSPSSYRKPCFK